MVMLLGELEVLQGEAGQGGAVGQHLAGRHQVGWVAGLHLHMDQVVKLLVGMKRIAIVLLHLLLRLYVCHALLNNDVKWKLLTNPNFGGERIKTFIISAMCNKGVLFYFSDLVTIT